MPLLLPDPWDGFLYEGVGLERESFRVQLPSCTKTGCCPPDTHEAPAQNAGVAGKSGLFFSDRDPTAPFGWFHLLHTSLTTRYTNT